jgi:hypothetical protein
MNEKEQPVDVTAPLLELLRNIDFAFERQSGGPATPQLMQAQYAAALVGIGRFLLKIDPGHADRFFRPVSRKHFTPITAVLGLTS